MKDIDELSKKTPVLCKVAPSSDYHVEDVNKAGGILSIMGELDRAGLLDTSARRIDCKTLKESIEENDIMLNSVSDEAIDNAKSAPGLSGRNLELASQENVYDELDRDRENGCIRNSDFCYNSDGGLTILYGNIAEKGSVVKTAGVDPSIFIFNGSTKVYDSQENACSAILGGKIKEGDVVVIRYEGPKGGPGMQEMLYPTSYIKSMKLDLKCALITDGRFSGGTSGLSVGHISPEAAGRGNIALIKDGDPIEINIPAREINLLISDDELDKRKQEKLLKGTDAYHPDSREREVSTALKAYSMLVSSADKGAIRLLSKS